MLLTDYIHVPDFHSSITHPIPVYRFQEIAGSLESSLSLPLKVLPSNKEDTPTDSSSANFRLELFQTLWEAIQKCWDESVYIAALVHRFWKLTLQVSVREFELAPYIAFSHICMHSRIAWKI